MYVQGVQTLSVKSKLAFLNLYNGGRSTIRGSNEPLLERNFAEISGSSNPW